MSFSVVAALLMLGLVTLTGHFIGFTDSGDDEFGESVPAFGKDQGATVVGGLADVTWISTISNILRKTGFIPTAVPAEVAGPEAVTTVAADSGVVVEATATEATIAEAKFAEATAGVEEFLSPFLNIYVLAEALEATLGFGEPYRGGDIEVGSKHFSVLDEQLNFAFPDESWQGLAMSAYSKKIVALQDISRKLAELDTRLAYHAEDHAKRVNDMRLGVGFLKCFAIVGHFCCPDEEIVLALAFSAYATLLSFTFKISRKHGNRVSNLCDEYQRLGAQMVSTGPLACAGGAGLAAARGADPGGWWGRLSGASEVCQAPAHAAAFDSTAGGVVAVGRVGVLAGGKPSSATAPVVPELLDATVSMPLVAAMSMPELRSAGSIGKAGGPGLRPASAEFMPGLGDFAQVARVDNSDNSDNSEGIEASGTAVGTVLGGRAQGSIRRNEFLQTPIKSASMMVS